MAERIIVGLASTLVVIAYLVWKRHYQWQNLFWTGGGWAVFFIVLAVSFGEAAVGPPLFLLGCVAGAAIQHGFDAEKRRSRPSLMRSSS